MARAKSDYEANLINTYAPKNATKIYQYINSITGQNNIPITVNYRSSSAMTDQDKASLFNLYFHSVFTQSTSILPSANELPTSKHCEDIVISEGDVHQILSNIAVNDIPVVRMWHAHFVTDTS